MSKLSNAVSDFQTLADQSYILTAFGGTHASGIVLVGTRKVGETKSRPTVLVTYTAVTPDPLTQGFVQVGFLFNEEEPDIKKQVTEMFQR